MGMCRAWAVVFGSPPLFMWRSVRKLALSSRFENFNTFLLRRTLVLWENLLILWSNCHTSSTSLERPKEVGRKAALCRARL